LLVVEDQKNMARFVAKGLREQGYAVDLATDGEEALRMTEEANYDLVILDLMIPKINGFEVCRTLRERGAHMPVLMLTARDDKASRIGGLDLGADDYLTKPFDFEELLARMRALLRRGTREYRSPSLVMADFELDTNRRVAKRAGREIPLTAKEFAIMEYFMMNPRRVITRTEIAEKLWDEHYDPFSNVIEVYIARLRKKIDGGSDVKLLHTRRGSGYLLEPHKDEGAE